MWAIINYYKDQEEDLEKYKLICKFANPEMAQKVFGEKTEDDLYSESSEDFIYSEIAKHTKAKLSQKELKKLIANPESSEENLDRIERIQ